MAWRHGYHIKIVSTWKKNTAGQDISRLSIIPYILGDVIDLCLGDSFPDGSLNSSITSLDSWGCWKFFLLWSSVWIVGHIMSWREKPHWLTRLCDRLMCVLTRQVGVNRGAHQEIPALENHVNEYEICLALFSLVTNHTWKWSRDSPNLTSGINKANT